MNRFQLSCLKSLFLVMAVFAVSCTQTEEKIVIVSTNDIHSSIDAFPSLATLVEMEREANPGKFLLVDAGDRWTGNPYVDRAPEKYKPIIDLMNNLGFDIATYGNHEWDMGLEILAKRTSEADFKPILANADMGMTSIPSSPPYIIKNIGGLRIAFLGLVTTAVNGHPDGIDANFGDIVFSDPIETAGKYIQEMEKKSDLIIGLTHIGLREDSLLAVRRPELNIIIGGHSHDVIPVGRTINNTVVTQTGKNLNYAGVTTIIHKGKKILSIDNRLVKLDTVPASPRYQALVDKYNNEPELKKVIGSVTAPMNKIALMNLFSDAMSVGTGSNFAFHNMGGMRIDNLAGDIEIGDVYAAEPFGNFPVVVYMTEEDIAEMILTKFNSTGKESHTLDLYPSGLTYEIITDSDGNGTDVILKHLYYPERGKVYTVALSNYVAGQYKYNKQRDGKAFDETTIADMAAKYIQKNSPIRTDSYNRVKIE